MVADNFKGREAMETLTRGLSRRSFTRILGTGSAAAPGAPAVGRSQAPAVAAPAPGAVVDDLVRLSANENPYGPSPAAFAAIQGAFDRACRYPDDELEALS